MCLPPILDSLFAALSSFPRSSFLSLGVGPSWCRAHCSRLLDEAGSHTLISRTLMSQGQSLAVVTPDQSGGSSVSFLRGTLS